MSYHLAIDYLSPTQISALQRCEQYYAYRYVAGKRDPGTEATATGAGFAVAVELLGEGAGDAIERGIATYREERPDVDPLWDDEDVRENERLVAESTIRHAAAGYVERYTAGDIAANVKREQTYIVDSGRVTLLARLDGVGDYIVEDKLRSGSSLRPEELEIEMSRGHQLTAEIAVVWLKTATILPLKFRQMRKPNRTKTKAMKLDADKIEEYVAEHYETAENAFAEYEVTRTWNELSRFVQEVDVLWRARDDILNDKRIAVRSPSECFKFGRTCPFAAECQGA